MIIVSGRIIKIFELILGQGIAGLAFYPFIFIAPGVKITDKLLNHERIHLKQQKELLVLPFYIWYLIALKRKGYYNISFEKEAYSNENNLNYLKERKIFGFSKYLKK